MKRLLTASVLGIAGTVGSVLLSTIESPVLATLLLAGGVNSLIGVLGGVIANDGSVVWDKIGEKLQYNDTILQNNDLQKAVGIAIAAIIAQTAKDENKVNIAYQAYIKKLGKYTANNWIRLCKEEIIVLNEDNFSPIQEHNLSSLMLQTSDKSELLRVFDTDENKDKKVWKNLVDSLINESQILSDLKTIEEEKPEINHIIDNLTEALSHKFLKAFREVLKEDFANGGKAFAGFTLDMFKELQQGINESQRLILEKLDNLTINNTGEGSQLLTELAKLYNCTTESKEEIKNKLNREFSQIDQQLNKLQDNNREAFINLGEQINSGFENIRQLLNEIDVKLDELLNITVSIKDDTEKILDTVIKLEKQQLISQQNTSPSLLITGDTPKAIANWQGRTEELKKLKNWILDADVNLVGIEGIGGMGKSSLAGKILADKEDIGLNERVTKRFWADVSNGALFVEVARRVLDEFEGKKQQRDETQLVNDLLKCLQSGQYLLVLDNFESLLLPNRSFKDSFYQNFFNAWCESGHQTTIVVTTREKPLLRGMEWINLEGLKVEEGANLLRELGIKGDLAGFSDLVGGYPLLLKLVADLLKAEYYEDPDLRRLELLGLGNLGEILTDERVKGQHRRETVGMVAVLDATTSRLTPQQKAFWCRLSVYQQGFDKLAAACMKKGQPINEIEAELKGLNNRSLLQRTLEGDDYVYQFQPVVKEYALIGLGDATEAHYQAIAYYESIFQANPNSWETVQPYLEIFYHYCQLRNYDTAFDTLREVDELLTVQGYFTKLIEYYDCLVKVWENSEKNYTESYLISLNSLGKGYFYLGNFKKAENYYRKAIKICKDTKNIAQGVKSLNGLGGISATFGNYEKSLKYYKKLFKIAQKIEDKQTQSMITANLGNIYGILGDYEQVIFYTDKSLKISREIGDKQGEITCLGNLGCTYEVMGNPQEALHYYQLSLEIAEKINSRRQKASSLGYIANYHRNLGQYEKAIELQKDSLEIYKSIKDNQGEAIALHDLANIYQCLNDFIKSIKYYEKSLEVFQKIGDKRGIADAVGSIGSSYFSLKEYSQSIDYNEQSLNLNRTINHKRGEAISLGNLGNIYTALTDYSKAIEYYQESLMLNEEIGHKGGVSINLGNLGNVERSLGNFQEAISYCQQSLVIKEQIGDQQGIAISLRVIGQCYYSLEQYDNAINSYEKSLEIANKISNTYMLAHAHFHLGETYKALNRNNEAIQSYHYARELYQRMGLDSNVEDCESQINALSSPQRLTIWQRIKQRLQGFLQWLRSLF